MPETYDASPRTREYRLRELWKRLMLHPDASSTSLAKEFHLRQSKVEEVRAEVLLSLAGPAKSRQAALNGMNPDEIGR